MAKNKTAGYYFFEDGCQMWVGGMSATEKRNNIRIHGRIIRFIPD
jgi:hypothetical protein